MSESIDGLVEAYDTRTGYVHRVPEHFLGDPMVGRFLAKTPGQRILDGDLVAPTVESTVPQIREFADAAGIDVTGLRAKDDLLAAVGAALEGQGLPTAPDSNDPNAPVTDTGTTTNSDAIPADDEPPVTGNEEN